MIALFVRSFLALALFLSIAGAATSSLDTVDIVATGVTAQEGGTPGRFTLSRTGSSGFLIVTFKLEGIATYSATGPSGVATSTTSNLDYGLTIDPSATRNGTTTTLPLVTNSSFTVTFAPGQQNIDIFVNAFEDGVKELQEDVRLRMLQSPTYIVGASSVATVNIADNDIVATLAMPDQTLSEFRGDPSPEGNFEILFNDISKTRFAVFLLEGTAIRDKDYAPKVMFMHEPSGGELASLTLNDSVTASYSFTPSGGSLLTGSLAGSGWYVNTPPLVTFDDLTSAELVASINQLQLTASDKKFTPGSTVVFNNIGTSTLTNGRSARGYGTVDALGQLVTIHLIDSGAFKNSDITSHPVLDFFPDGTVVNSSGAVDKATATVVASVPAGSRAACVNGLNGISGAVLNGIVTNVVIGQGGTAYTSATVSFTPKSGDTTGKDAAGTVVRSGTSVIGVIITNPGSGYAAPPDVTIVGDGSGATATAFIEGPVRRVDVTNAGLGYASVPAFVFTRTGATPSQVGQSLVDADPVGAFSRGFNALVGHPDFFTQRSSGPDDRSHFDWLAKLDSTDINAATINKKNFSTLSVTAGFGPLTIGDVITVAGDAQQYFVIGKSLPLDKAGGIFYKLTVSPALQADVADDAVVTNAINITPSIGNLITFRPPGSSAGSQVGYYGLDVGITPIDDTEVEGAETVTLRLVANNDYAIQNPTVQTMEIADDDAVANIVLVNNGSEPNLSGQARVTLSKALLKDVTIPFLMSGTATPGAGLDSDPKDSGVTAQAQANNSDYILTGIVDIVPPTVDISGNVTVQASARGSVTIPAGQTSVDLVIGVQDDAFIEGSETVVIALQRTNDVVLAGTTSADGNPSVTINISDNLGTVSVGNPVNGIEDPTTPTPGKVRFIVDGNPRVATTNVGVGFSIGGSATIPADYVLGGGSFTVNPTTGDGSAVLKVQTPIWVTAVNSTTITLNAADTNPLADTDPLVATGLSAATIADGSTVVIGGSAYTVTTGLGASTLLTVRSDNTTTVTLSQTLVDSIVGKVIKTSNATNKGSTTIRLSPAVAVNLPPKTGLLIKGRIYLSGNTDVLPMSTGGVAVQLVPALKDDVAANDDVFIAFRPATDLIIQVKDDLKAEGTEAVLVNLKTGSGYSISAIASSASAAITDDEPQISVTATRDAFEPGVGGIFTISYERFDKTALNRAVEVFFTVTTPSSTQDAFGFPMKSDDNGVSFSVDGAGNKHFYATPGLDYQAFSTFSLTIPAGSTSVDRNVDIISDAVVEQSEEVQISISASPTNEYAVKSGIASVVINDAPTVSVKTIRDASEAGVTGVIRFSRTLAGSTPGFFGAIDVQARIVQSSSTAVPDVIGTNASFNDFPINGNSFLSQPGGDGTEVLVKVTIPDGQEFVDVTVPVTDDDVADKGEILVFEVKPSANYNLSTTSGSGLAKSCTMNIIDNEPGITITAGRDANEGGQLGQIVIGLAAPVPATHGAFKVPLKLAGDAIFGTDYTITGQIVDPLSQTLIVDFPISQSTVTLTIVPRVANGITDPVRTLTVSQAFGSSNLATGRVVTSSDPTLSASIKILDDLPVISLIRNPTLNDTDLAEPSTNGSFRIFASVVPVADLTVNFSLPGSSSLGFATLGDDYVIAAPATDHSAVILKDQQFVDVGVNVLNESLIEGIENIDIALLPNGVKYAIDPAKSTLTLLIGDDEFTEGLPKVSVEADTVTAYEEKSVPGSFAISRSLGVGPMIVDFVMSGTATTADYTLTTDPDPANKAVVNFDTTAARGTIVFPGGQATMRVIITPVDDSLPEGIETVVFTISPKKVYDISERSSASIEIADNDIVSTLTVIDPNAAETSLKSGQFRITSIPSNVARDYSFRLEGTAKPGKSIDSIGADYTLFSRLEGGVGFTQVNMIQAIAEGRLTDVLPANVNFIDYQVVITRTASDNNSDLEAEGRETAIFTLEESNEYALGSPRSGLVTISDNDVQVTIKAKDGGEPATSGNFTVTLSQPFPVDVSIPFTVSGTATPGADYTALQPLTIKAGETTGAILVDVHKDNIEEPTETVKINLANSLDYVISGSPSATVNIVDLYATVSVTAAPDFGSERYVRPATSGTPSADDNTSRFKITALRLARIDGKSPGFTVFYTLSGSATAGLDYATPAPSGQIAIPDGVSEVFLNIDPISDDILEGDESILLTLLAGPGYDIDGTKSSATLTILDSAPILSIIKKSDGNEAGKQPVVFTISYTGSALSRPVKVFYQNIIALSSPATVGVDFNIGDGFVIIPSGKNTIDLSLAVVDDAIVESTENVLIGLSPDPSSVPSYGVNLAQIQATASILDNEPTVSVQVTSATSVTEGGVDGVFTLSYGGSALDRDVGVTFQLSGTATLGADYSVLGATNGIATIPATENSVVVKIRVVDDAIRELDETVIMTLPVNEAGGYRLSTGQVPAIAQLTIQDNDNVTPIIISVTKITDADETGIVGKFRIALSDIAPVDTVIAYSLSGTAQLGTDFTIPPSPVTIPAGVQLIDLLVDAKRDGIAEVDETVIFTLGTPPLPRIVTYANDSVNGSAQILIHSDPRDAFPEGLPLVGVEADRVTAYEKDEISGSFNFTRSLTSGNLDINFTLTGLAASADYQVLTTDDQVFSAIKVDFNAGTGVYTIHFTPGVSSIPVFIKPIDDHLAEGIENVIVTIVPDRNYDVSARSSSSIDIADNDIVTTLTITDPLAVEATLKSGQFRITSVPSTVPRDFTFRVDGTATLGNITETAKDYALKFRFQGDPQFSDFKITGSTTNGFRVFGTLPTGIDFIDFQVAITRDSNNIDDITPEGRETAIFTLEDSNEFSLGSPRSGLITIADNDVQVTISANDGGEPRTSGSFTVKLSNPLPVDVSIPYTVSGTATPSGTIKPPDYTALQPLIIKAGDTVGTLLVDVLQDVEVEPTETVKITLSNSLDYVISGSASATVNILDQIAVISATASGSPAAEPDVASFFTISAARLSGKTEAFRVRYALSGTATEGLDYVSPATRGEIIIPADLTAFPAVTAVTIQIVPIADTFLEGDESVILTLLSGPQYDIDPAKSSATMKITDAAPIVSIEKVSDGAEPSTAVVFKISYPGVPVGSALPRNLKVFYQLDSSSTATPGADFALSPDGFITIPANNLFVQLSLSVLDDTIVESDETVVIRLLPDSSGNPVYGINSGASVATAVIHDDEPTVSITGPVAGTSLEEGTSGAFTIGYTGTPLTRAVNVLFVMSGAATQTADYTMSNFTSVTIPSGQPSVTIPFVVVDDTTPEDRESIIMTLTPNLSGGYRLGANTSARVDINLSDGKEPITVSVVATQDATETGTIGKAIISMSRIGLDDTVIPFVVSGTATATATATSTLDYAALPSVVIIPAGSTTATLQIRAVADGTLEPDETVVITLTPSPSFILGNGTATVVIKSDPNDGPPNGSLVGNETGGKGGCGSGGGIALMGLTSLLLFRRRRS